MEISQRRAKALRERELERAGAIIGRKRPARAAIVWVGLANTCWLQPWRIDIRRAHHHHHRILSPSPPPPPHRRPTTITAAAAAIATLVVNPADVVIAEESGTPPLPPLPPSNLLEDSECKRYRRGCWKWKVTRERPKGVMRRGTP